jgi:hypothetical protein
MPTSEEQPEHKQSATTPTSLVELAKSVLPSAATLIAISGGLIYAAVALGYQDFYGTFGLAPSDVGITQSDIVAQTAVAMATVGIVVLLLWLLLYFIAALLAKFIPKFLIIIAVAIYSLIGAPLLILAYPVLREPAPGILAVIAMAILGVPAALAARWRRDRQPLERFKFGVLLVAGLASLFLVGSLFTIARADELGRAVSLGYTFPPGGRFTFWLDVRADPVCVTKSQLQPLSEGSVLYYLGRSGEWLNLYDPIHHRTISRPRSGLQLVFIPYPYWPEPRNGRNGILYRYDDFDGMCSRK